MRGDQLGKDRRSYFFILFALILGVRRYDDLVVPVHIDEGALRTHLWFRWRCCDRLGEPVQKAMRHAIRMEDGRDAIRRRDDGQALSLAIEREGRRVRPHRRFYCLRRILRHQLSRRRILRECP